MSADTNPHPRPRRRKWPYVLFGIVLVALLAYPIAGNVLLMTGVLEQIISRKPEKLKIQWEHAWTLLPGRIRVEIANSATDAAIHIIDNGLGLPSKERHRLAEPYMTTRAKGTGLGLAIVKKVAEEHGGSLAFADDGSLGPSGARITMTLPRIDAAELETPEAATAAAE